jgi:hypothetical protein
MAAAEDDDSYMARKRYTEEYKKRRDATDHAQVNELEGCSSRDHSES